MIILKLSKTSCNLKVIRSYTHRQLCTYILRRYGTAQEWLSIIDELLLSNVQYFIKLEFNSIVYSIVVKLGASNYN